MASVCTAVAVPITPFQGWGWLEENSQDIIIARCSETPPQHYRDDLAYSKIKVTTVLKGTNSLGAALLLSQFQPLQREDYLIFADFHDGSYYAVEKYRVVPLGLNLAAVTTESFNTNMIAGKSLDEQIQTLLKLRLNELNRQMQEEQEEKDRLEEAVQK